MNHKQSPKPPEKHPDNARPAATPGKPETETPDAAPGLSLQQQRLVSPAESLRLQQTIGNRAVGRVIQNNPAEYRSIQRQRSSVPTLAVQRKGSESDQKAGDELQKRAAAASKKFQSGYSDVNSTVIDSLTTIDAARSTYLSYATQYDSAYATVQGVLAQAKESLELQDKAVDTIVGIAIGVGVGLATGGLGEALEITGLLAKAAWEAVGESLEAGAGWGVGKLQSDKRDASAKALTDPPGTTPTALKLEIWQKLADAYRSTAVISTEIQPLADTMHFADLVSADALVHKSGGKSEKPIAEIEKAVIALEKVAAKQDALQASMAKLKASTDKLKGEASKAAAPDVKKLEQQIWIEWMADLPEEASNRLLDNDTIEDHLRAVGVLTDDKKAGVLKADFGMWTSKEDTDQAAAEAKTLRVDTYRDAFGPQQVGKVAAITTTGGNGDVVTFWMVKIPDTRWDWPVAVSPVPDETMTRKLPVLGEKVKITGYDPGNKQLTGIGPV